MQHILVYSDSLTWGIIPHTRQRLPFEKRWPGVMELAINRLGHSVRVIEDCLNGRRTMWEDPAKEGRNGLIGLAQRIEIHSPLSLVILMLGTNDFQAVHEHHADHAAQGLRALIAAIRTAPIEPGMPTPPILVLAPPAIQPPKGSMAQKFAGGELKCLGLAAAYADVCQGLNCHFFDTGRVIASSKIDGVHLDSEDHLTLGNKLSEVVCKLLF